MRLKPWSKTNAQLTGSFIVSLCISNSYLVWCSLNSETDQANPFVVDCLWTEDKNDEFSFSREEKVAKDLPTTSSIKSKSAKKQTRSRPAENGTLDRLVKKVMSKYKAPREHVLNAVDEVTESNGASRQHCFFLLYQHSRERNRNINNFCFID